MRELSVALFIVAALLFIVDAVRPKGLLPWGLAALAGGHLVALYS